MIVTLLLLPLFGGAILLLWGSAIWTAQPTRGSTVIYYGAIPWMKKTLQPGYDWEVTYDILPLSITANVALSMVLLSAFPLLVRMHLRYMKRSSHCYTCGYPVTQEQQRCPECGNSYQSSPEQKWCGDIGKVHQPFFKGMIFIYTVPGLLISAAMIITWPSSIVTDLFGAGQSWKFLSGIALCVTVSGFYGCFCMYQYMRAVVWDH